MFKKNENKQKDMCDLCSSVKKMVRLGNFNEAFKITYESMAKFPNNPEPHNLLGILLEKEGKHILAMKHFRIAWVLDPTYQPASENLSNFGNFIYCEKYAYDESDCPDETKHEYGIIYDEKHIGHVERIK